MTKSEARIIHDTLSHALRLMNTAVPLTGLDAATRTEIWEQNLKPAYDEVNKIYVMASEELGYNS